MDTPAAPVATVPPPPVVAAPTPRRTPPRVEHLPPFKVILHNDDQNDMWTVTIAIMQAAGVDAERAYDLMMEAHTAGVALLRVTHREHAELIVDRLKSKNLTATMEAA